MTAFPKHHHREYLEKIIRETPGGITVADVCRMFGISTRAALEHLRGLADDKRIRMRLEDNTMVFRIREDPPT